MVIGDYILNYGLFSDGFSDRIKHLSYKFTGKRWLQVAEVDHNLQLAIALELELDGFLIGGFLKTAKYEVD